RAAPPSPPGAPWPAAPGPPVRCWRGRSAAVPALLPASARATAHWVGVPSVRLLLTSVALPLLSYCTLFAVWPTSVPDAGSRVSGHPCSRARARSQYAVEGNKKPGGILVYWAAWPPQGSSAASTGRIEWLSRHYLAEETLCDRQHNRYSASPAH